MTRLDEIKKKMLELEEETPNWKDTTVYVAGFMDGAMWADEHPKQIEISLEDIEELAKVVIPDDWVKRQDTLWEMIRRNQRAQFINKACEWIERNYHATPMGGYYYLPEDCIEQFKQAMKGE